MNRKPPKSDVFYSFVNTGALFLVFLSLLAFVSSAERRTIYDNGPNSFVKTSGVVAFSGSERRATGSRVPATDSYSIKLNYVVNRVTYETEYSGGPSSEERGATPYQMMKKYPVGKRVDVYYAPSDVEFAITYPPQPRKEGANVTSRLALVSGIVSIVLFIWSIGALLRARRYSALNASSLSGHSG